MVGIIIWSENSLDFLVGLCLRFFKLGIDCQFILKKLVVFYALHEQTYKKNICDISRNKSKKEVSVLVLMVPVG